MCCHLAGGFSSGAVLVCNQWGETDVGVREVIDPGLCLLPVPSEAVTVDLVILGQDLEKREEQNDEVMGRQNSTDKEI